MDRVNGANTVDIGGGRRGFRKQDAAAGLSGTEITPAFLNGLQEEVLAVIAAAEIVPDAASWTQLRDAIAHMISVAIPSVGGFVARAGDTMTGNLSLGFANPNVLLLKTASGQSNDLQGRTAGFLRWIMSLGDATAEAGANAGSLFRLAAYSDAGAYVATALTGRRSDGRLLVAADPIDVLGIATKGYVDALAGQMVVSETYASGTAGPSMTAGAWTDRALNTVEYNSITGAGLSGGVVTLPAGTYMVSALGYAFNVGPSRLRLRNITDGTDAVIGVNVSANTNDPCTVAMSGVFTIAATKQFRVGFWASQTGTQAAGSLGVVEKFLTCTFGRIA